MTGATVETAIRVVSHWMRDGWVADDGGSLVLRNLDACDASPGATDADVAL